MNREKLRARMMRNNRRVRRETEQILIDEAWWNEHVRKPDEPRINTDADGFLTLSLQWLDQQYEELRNRHDRLSDPPPRLAEYLRSREG